MTPPIPNNDNSLFRSGRVIHFGTGSGSRTHTVAHWNLNPARLPIPPYPHIQFPSIFTRGGGARDGVLHLIRVYKAGHACFYLIDGKFFTEVTAPKSRMSTNSITGAYSVLKIAGAGNRAVNLHRGDST